MLASKYIIIAPIMIPKICKDNGLKSLESYTFIWRKKDNYLATRIVGDGKEIISEKTEPRAMEKLEENILVGNFVRKVKTEEPEAALIMVEMNTTRKEISVNYFREDNSLIRSKLI